MTKILSFGTSIFKRFFGSGLKPQLNSVQPSQVASLTDLLIQVDANDVVLGSLPKLDGHLPAAINTGIFHRAFSVFLFEEGSHSLLVQKRASTKIVFPRQWANTCCSHPLYVESEMENIEGDQIGIKRATVKRLHAELGLSGIDPTSLNFVDKIVYSQLSPGGSFGESEVDYILFSTLNTNKCPVLPVADEVEEFQWIRPGPTGNRVANLKEFLNNETRKGFPPTPWFSLMINEGNCLEEWWNSLINGRIENRRENVPVRSFLA